MKRIILIVTMLNIWLLHAGGNEVELPVFMSKKNTEHVTFLSNSVMWKNKNQSNVDSFFKQKNYGEKKQRSVLLYFAGYVVQDGKVCWKHIKKRFYREPNAFSCLRDDWPDTTIETTIPTPQTFHTFTHLDRIHGKKYNTWRVDTKQNKDASRDYIDSQVLQHAWASNGHYNVKSKLWLLASVIKEKRMVKGKKVFDRFKISLEKCKKEGSDSYHSAKVWGHRYRPSDTWEKEYLLPRESDDIEFVSLKPPRMLFSECGTYLSVTFPDHEGRTQVYDVAAWLKALKNK